VSFSDLPEHDHRKLGQRLDLFSFSESVGPGLVLWHPKGALVRSLLESSWRKLHTEGGYDFVISPHVGRSSLWETSGHLDFYRDAMFPPMELGSQAYYAKPMNCPFHMEIFASHQRSYRELPLRFAELGTVYRYEASGVVQGLLRVRGFTQDDAHIFCRPDQVVEEIAAVAELAQDFLGRFEFEDLRFYLSTKPDKSVGEESQWSSAIASLAAALERLDIDHAVDEGGGAFYGPKLDVHVRDAQGRDWQLSTIQFDFNLPQRFGLRYIGEDGAEHAPLVIHRALFGSLERFFAILLEHYRGALPFWLAPVQATVLPVSERHHAYAREIARSARERGVRIDVDARNEPLGARVRCGKLMNVPYLLVVGDRELAMGTISVRPFARKAPVDYQLDAWLESLETCPNWHRDCTSFS
jgi:threonyl-tRNA synthetase